MINKILKEVKSPFTDELIKGLIEKYVNCGCDNGLFYNEVNKVDNYEQDSNLREVLKNIYAQGISKLDAFLCDDKEKTKFLFEDKTSWMILSSGEDPLKIDRKKRDEKLPLVYRIYLNLKGKQKNEFIENYLKRMQDAKMPFEFKFSKDDSRLDQIVILSREEHFVENISIVQELTKDMQLGEVPPLVGEYQNGIGIGEEPYYRLYSPTQIKLALVRSSVKKYLCDHFDEFKEQLSDEEKKEIEEYIYYFEYNYKSEQEDMEDEGEDYEDIRKQYYQEKYTLECLKEHIETVNEAYVCGIGLANLSNVIKNIYLSNQEQLVSEVIRNYRMIGTQVWGMSNDFIFSNETEKKLLIEENVDFLSAEQIGTELEKISRTGLTDKVQTDFVSMAEVKEETNNLDFNLE